jgi:rRNA maturation endonuclease Nob1
MPRCSVCEREFPAGKLVSCSECGKPRAAILGGGINENIF